MTVNDAFISYSHAKDKPVAAALQRVVQNLGKPWYRRRALRLFRDDTSLSAAPELWPAIEEALSRSRFLILLASPEAAASQWVNREVAYWLAHKGIGTLLIAVTDGTLVWDEAAGDFRAGPDLPLPSVLARAFPSEPKWVDLRPYREGSTDDRKFLELGADFAAAIHGMPKEDLLSEEVRQQRTALTLAYGAVAALTVFFGAAAYQWWEAERALKRAELLIEGTSRSSAVIGDMFDSGSLPTAVAQQILDVLRGTYAQLARDAFDPSIAPAQLRTLDVLSRSYFAVGHIQDALDTATTARRLAERLTAYDSTKDDWQDLLAQAHKRVGIALRRQGKVDDALAALQSSRTIAERLARAYPDDRKRQRELAINLEIISDTLKAQGDLDGAYAENNASLALYARLGSQWDVANSRLRNGDIHWDKEELDLALAEYRKAVDINAGPADQATPSIEPERNWKWSAALAYLRLGNALRLKGARAEALTAYRSYMRMAVALETRDPVNEVWQRQKARSHAMIGDMLFAGNELTPAAHEYQAVAAIARQLVERDTRNRLAQQELAQSHRRFGELSLAQNRPREALAPLRTSLKLTDELALADRSNINWQEDLAVAHERLGDALRAAGEADAALAEYRSALTFINRLVGDKPNPRATWREIQARAYARIGLIFAAQNRPDDARGALSNCLAVKPVPVSFDLRNIAPQDPQEECRRALDALAPPAQAAPARSAEPATGTVRAQ